MGAIEQVPAVERNAILDENLLQFLRLRGGSAPSPRKNKA